MTTNRPPGLIAAALRSSPSADVATARSLAADVALLWLRVSFGLALALSHGLSKIQDPAHFLENVARRGFPAPTLLGWFAILSELVGGIALALGLFTRAAGACIAATLLAAAIQVHADDPFAKKELALAYAVIGLAFVASGAGRYSLDAFLPRKRRRGA